jgi:hypothetical protein
VRCGDGVAIDVQRVAVAESFDEPHRKAAAQHAVHRVVMAHGRDAGEEILQPADPHAVVQRLRSGHRQRRITGESRLKVGNPFAGVGVFLPPLEARLRIELEVIVRVDQSGEDEAALEIDHRIAFVGRDVDAVDEAVADAQGSSEAAGDHDLGVHEGYLSTPEHSLLSFCGRSTLVRRSFYVGSTDGGANDEDGALIRPSTR